MTVKLYIVHPKLNKKNVYLKQKVYKKVANTVI